MSKVIHNLIKIYKQHNPINKRTQKMDREIHRENLPVLSKFWPNPSGTDKILPISTKRDERWSQSIVYGVEVPHQGKRGFYWPWRQNIAENFDWWGWGWWQQSLLPGKIRTRQWGTRIIIGRFWHIHNVRNHFASKIYEWFITQVRSQSAASSSNWLSGK